MNNNFRYIITLVAVFIIKMASAQSVIPNFQNQTVHKDEFLVRWEPRSLKEWNTALKEGYAIKVWAGKDTDNLTVIEETTIKAASEKNWDSKIAATQDTLLRSYYEGSKSLIYTPEEMKEGLLDALVKEDGKPLKQTADEFRMIFLVYGISCEFDVAKMAGLAHKVKIQKGNFYKIEVQTKGHPPYVFELNSNKKRTVVLPELTAKFENRKVTLDWNTSNYDERFFGYRLEVSENGQIFQPVTDIPYSRFIDSLSTLNSFTIELPLSKNYHQHWIRLRGVDYFGKTTTQHVEIKGYGYDEIRANPSISFADQTADNEADIQWVLDESFNRLVKFVEIHRKDSLQGAFEVVVDSLPAHTRAVKIPMTEPSNYFSVTLIPKDGEMIRSFPVYIMGQDTIPPITPQNFDGKIDSLGIVRLVWNKNQEPDLWGYKVFRSEFIEDEFACMHSSPILDTFLIDTINLNSLNEEIHYSIIALDKRNNRSPFTIPLTLQRPDTIPPTPPLIRNLAFMEDSIKIEWAASSSEDVVVHQLFRKKSGEDGWVSIAALDSVDMLNFYYDKDIEMGSVYAYTILAKDDNDLVSELSQPLVIKTKSKKPKDAFQEFEVTINKEEKQSIIDWKLKNSSEIVEIEVYRGKTKEDIAMLEILEPDTNWLEQPLKKGDKWYFLFKPIYEDGSFAKMSKMIEIVYPEE